MMSGRLWALLSFERAVVRTLQLDGEPSFVAADVCAVLGLDNTTKALMRLDADEQTLISIQGIHSGPGNPHVKAINESGLYSLTLTSRKPVAKRFKRWVTSDVLPAIRKTGSGHQSGAAHRRGQSCRSNHRVGKAGAQYLRQAAQTAAFAFATAGPVRRGIHPSG